MNIKKLCAALSALCMANAVFSAQTLRVVSRAEDKTGVWSDAYLSINDAIAAARTGEEASHDTILVASGTYNIDAPITVPENAKLWLAIRSANIETGDEDRDGTILNGGGTTQIMKILSAAVTVSGFTFQDGYLESASYTSYNGGAAIYAPKHKVVVRNCVFRGNRTVNAAGTCICCSGSGHTLTVSRCVFTNNTQDVNISGKAAKGLAVFCQNSTVTVEDCLFDNNRATAESMNGLLTAGEGKGWQFDGCTFLTNTFAKTGTAAATHYAGCVNLYGSSAMRNCRFSCNAFGATGSDAVAGSILNVADSCMLSNCTFTSIVDSNNDSSLGTIRVVGNDVSFIDCAFTENEFGRYFIEIDAKTNTLFRNCLFADNKRKATYYRIVRQNGCPAGAGLVLENCTFANNTDMIGGTEVHMIGSGGTSSCTNIYVNTVFTGYLHPAPSGIRTIARNCCFGSLYNDNFLEKTDCFMISDVPACDLKFMDASHGDYALQRKSPLREMGRMLPWMTVDAVDLGGGLRVVSGTGEPLAVDPSALPDIGCYECALKPLGLSLIIR